MLQGSDWLFSESTGEIKYAAPDKGLFRVKSSKQWNAEKRKYDARPSNSGEHWVCNGTSIYEFRHSERQLRETKLPPEMRGRAISEGPLPFVFGAKADTLKKRYSMRIITPPSVTDQIWLEALPKFQVDAANFSKVELILRAADLMPFAIQVFKPGGQDRDVYQFDPRTSLIDRGLDLIRDFFQASHSTGIYVHRGAGAGYLIVTKLPRQSKLWSMWYTCTSSNDSARKTCPLLIQIIRWQTC